LIGISNNFYINVGRLQKLIEQIHEVAPDLPILVGGQALSGGQSDILKKYPNVSYVSNLDELEEIISNFSK
ncbi:MAG: cobalamin-binding protein, partial [Ignavibacteria bacterium]|nr:cobalamin-binding protein [Ignavibacteria bacterium]